MQPNEQRRAGANELPTRRTRLSRLATRIRGHGWLYVLLLPGLIFYLVYVYLPLLGSVIAFQDFSPFRGFTGSAWVGLKHFERLFSDRDVGRVLWNTVVLSLCQIIFAFPVSIVLALMLNEVRARIFKSTVQSVLYLPHFLSWVIIVGIWYQIFGTRGIANQALVELGFERVNFLTSEALFRPMFVLQTIWKEAGWGTILFLAALAGIDADLYEAAALDGASRWQRTLHITLPGLTPIIILLLILRLGNVLNVGFEHVFLLLNSSTERVAQVLDTFVYYRGIVNGDFSFATAVGLVKGLVGLVLVLGANQLAKRFGEEGVF